MLKNTIVFEDKIKIVPHQEATISGRVKEVYEVRELINEVWWKIGTIKMKARSTKAKVIEAAEELIASR